VNIGFGIAILDPSTQDLRQTGSVKLSRLELDNTHVTDVGLANLKALTSLSELDLSGTQVTDDGLNELKRALSRLTTYHRIDAIPTGLEATRSVRIH
jgi:hypothetical protein